MQIKIKNKGQFTSESLKGNQYAKGNLPNKSTFKIGEKTMEKHPSWKGGIQKHKEGYYIQLSTNKRMKLARYVYQQTYGEIPKGYVIYHLDGDQYNDEPSNLMAITRAELIKLNNNSTI
jgi:hypothetical protein